MNLNLNSSNNNDQYNEIMCSVHPGNPLQFICQSGSCNYLPLCNQCKKKHNPEHNNSLIRYSYALQKARKNLQSQIHKLDQYITPYQQKRQAERVIIEQIQQLQKQRNRIIEIIKQKIDKQILEIKKSNYLIDEDQSNFYKQLIAKRQNLNDVLRQITKKPNILREALVSQIQAFLIKIGQKNIQMTKRSTDSNRAYLYDKVEHQFIISDLKLKTKIVNPKLLKKVYNQSPLYFLIDSKYQTGKFLHFFAPKLRQIRIYDVEIAKWYKYTNRNFDFGSFQEYSTVVDHINQIYYFIGGRGSKQIVWFDKKNQSWAKSNLNQNRRSPMTTVIFKPNSNELNYVLIAGGIADSNKVLQSWQLFDPKFQKVVYTGEMNFATASGKLVTFEKNIVFRIGGFSKKNNSEYGICPIVQKCDFSQLLKVPLSDKLSFKFTYIEIQDICKDSLQLMDKKYDLFYANQGAIQINSNEIFIFGGRVDKNKCTSQTYILNIEKFQMMNYKKQKVNSYRYYARWINQKPMISSEDFQYLTPIIWKDRIYSLQNISGLKSDSLHKRLVQFDMKCWYQTENIVDQDLIK